MLRVPLLPQPFGSVARASPIPTLHHRAGAVCPRQRRHTLARSLTKLHYTITQITVLDGTPFAWLREMLEAFNAGDLHAYDALCEKHADALNGQPALVEHERALREKITILCLTELIFTCAPVFTAQRLLLPQ